MKSRNPLVALVAVLVLVGGAGGYAYFDAHRALTGARLELSEATSTVATLESTLAAEQDENERLVEALAAERGRNDAFEEQISDISGTVGRLDKLSRTDPEFLQKYSKVYFLNENYIPEKIVQIPEEWTNNAEEEYIHAEIWTRLKKMLEAAREDGIELRIISGYRSFEKQALLKSSYTVRYGSGANSFSADQGYSEHQLGTTIDFTTPELGGGFSAFAGTEAYAWLLEHGHRYGFILSYPKDNAYYVYEPWHWRYVGRSLAEDLEDEGKSFYDLDQRELDEYLIDFFD